MMGTAMKNPGGQGAKRSRMSGGYPFSTDRSGAQTLAHMQRGMRSSVFISSLADSILLTGNDECAAFRVRGVDRIHTFIGFERIFRLQQL